MHGEVCMPQAAALRMSLWVPARNEWTEWMSTLHDYDMCPSNVRLVPQCVLKFVHIVDARTFWSDQRVVTNCRMWNLRLVPQYVLRFVHIVDARTLWPYQCVVANCRIWNQTLKCESTKQRQLVTTRWWRQNVRASKICTNLRTHCGTSLREKHMDGLSLECGAEWTGVWNLLGGTAKRPQSVTKNSSNDRFRMTSHWECFVAEWWLPRNTSRRGWC